MIRRPTAWVFRHLVLVASRRPQVAGQHQEPAGAVQVERGVHGGSIAVTNLVKIAALVADLAATS